MQILIADQFSDPGGAQQVLMELLPAFQGRGWKARVCAPGDGELLVRARALGFETAEIDCGPFTSGRKSAADAGRWLAQMPRLAGQLGRMATEIGADLVYLNGPRLLPAAAMAGLEAPVLFHSHSYLAPGAVRTLAGLALRSMEARVIGSCRFVAEAWRGFLPEGRVSVIYNGVAGVGVAERRKGGGGPVVGCIGRISPEKGQREFVEAAAAIHRALPDCRFVIYGKALFADEAARRYSEEVRAAAEGLPVEFAGWVDDVYQALARMDLLLAPCGMHEATTRVILEAFSAGVPVIAFPSGGIPEVIEDGRTGYLASSAAEMARLAIELVSGDGLRRAAIAVAARQNGERRFTLQRFQREMIASMERLTYHLTVLHK